MPTSCTTSHTRRQRRGPIVVVLAACALLLAVPSNASSSRRGGDSYGWPVKPFHRAHPVRGSFGDPRTLFHGPPTLRGLLSGPGIFSFHQGVDIAAANGTAVYPVVSGVVQAVTPKYVTVATDGGRVFAYWHIRAAVSPGRAVTAYATVLGRIERPAMHVHLTEFDHGRPVNPLVRGRLTPYGDTTPPSVNAITFRATETGRDLLPTFLRGRVLILAQAEDTPSLAVHGQWGGLPVTPATVAWRIERPGGKVVVRQRRTYDVRESLPSSAFWSVYARGTYQNMSVFGAHYAWLQRGCYLFKLGWGALDTHGLRDGVYEVVVTATDIRGNAATRRARFTVHNRPGWGR